MKSNQRKEIITQVLDLINARKAINIDGINVQGLSFSSEPRLATTPVPSDKLIEWDSVFYTRETSDFPSLFLFNNLDLLDGISINKKTLTSLNGLTDSALSYQTNIKYTTTIYPNTTIRSTLSVYGKCKSTLYINDQAVLRHNPTGTEVPAFTTTTLTEHEFSLNTPYKITLVVYCNYNDPSNRTVSVSGDLFRNIQRYSLEEVNPPINLFATTNLLDTIRVSWEQRNTAYLHGGGVEVWSKPANTEDSTYTFLDRVQYPNNYYLHTFQTSSQNIVPNGTFENTLGTSEELPESDVLDSSGLYRWGISLGSDRWGISLGSVGSVTKQTSGTLPGYSSYITLKTTADTRRLANVLHWYNLQGNETQRYINRSIPRQFVEMTYAADHSITVSAFSGNTSATDVTFFAYWEPSENIATADVLFRVFNGTSVYDSSTIDASCGSITYKFPAALVTQYNTDSTRVKFQFITKTSLRNLAPTSAYIGLKSAYIEEGYQDGILPIYIYSDLLPYDQKATYTLDVVYKGNYQSDFYALVYSYDENETILNIEYTPITKTNAVTSTEAWNRFVIPVASASENAKYIRIYIVHAIANTIKQDSYIDLQKVNVIKSTGKSLPTNSAFSYKIRNYTQDLRFSPFTNSVVGEVNRDVYYIDISPDTEYLGYFKPTVVSARASSSLSSVSVRLQDNTGGSVIELAEVARGTNNADFTFECIPLFANAFLYDNFSYDYTALPGAASQKTITNNFNSIEQSPARASGKWTISGSYVTANRNSSIGHWGSGNADFNNYIYFDGVAANNKKLYKYTSYSNFIGATTASNKKLSVGMILSLRNFANDLGTDRLILLRRTSTFGVYYYPATKVILCAIKGNSYTGDSNWGTILLRHSLNPTAGIQDWYFVHFSVDFDRKTDSNYTYSTVYNITQDTTIANSATAYQQTEGASTRIAWGTEDTEFGVVNTITTSTAWDLYFDNIYATQNVVKKDTLNEKIIPHIVFKNTNYPNFGHPNNGPLTLYAEGRLSSAVDNDVNSGEVPYDADIVTDTYPVVCDYNEPDGTMYILREAFTIDQVDIDTISAQQPLYTYGRSNKVYVDFNSIGAPIKHVRFSNDRTSWSEFKTFSNRILYPWDLFELGLPSDTNEGGLRTVWVQAKTESGNTSNFWLKAQHKDTIYFNPLASVGSLDSYNYVKGESGWQIGLNGDAEFNNIHIRKNASFSGRSVTPALMETPEIRGQYASEYAKGVYGKYRTVGDPSNIMYNTRGSCLINKNFGIDGTMILTEYCSDFVVDCSNEDVVYIPLRRTSFGTSTSTIAKINMLSNYTTNVYWSGKVYNQDTGERLLPHIALDGNYLYVGDYTTVYKINKATMQTISSLNLRAELDVPTNVIKGGRITGMTIGVSEDGHKYLYIAHGLKEDGGIPSGNSYISLSLIDTTTFTRYTGAYRHWFGLNSTPSLPFRIDSTVSMMPGNHFDCNGIYAVSIDGTGRFFYKRLKSNGVFDTTTPTINETWAWYAPTLLNTGRYSKPTGGVKILGSKVVLYSRPSFYNVNPYFKNGAIDCLIRVFDLLYGPPNMAGVRTIHYAMPGPDNSRVRKVFNDFAANLIDTSSSLTMYNMSLFAHSATTPQMPGFGVPTMVGTSLYVPYNNAYFPDGLVLKYNCLCDTLDFGGIASTKKAQVLKYDGKYLWSLWINYDTYKTLSIARQLI